MRSWDGFEKSRLITDGDGVVLFEVQPGSLVENANAETELASVLVTAEHVGSSYELQERVMAALRTQEREREQNRKVLYDKDAAPYLEFTSHSNGDKTIMEIQWLKGRPSDEEVEMLRSIFRGMVTRAAIPS